ncbi:MAG: DUF2911 domain-containing protein [Gemmatimonadales bacterium]|nr:DUF2911 domain-containing protein [Gemmatimonadales bacterium]MDZ4391242.1 DUF2911 domain-containing protein [Gemmatimonadales bacterium]
MRKIVIGIAMCGMALFTAPSLSAQAIEIFQLSGRGTTTLTKQMPDDATGPAPTITLDWGQPHLRERVLHEDGFIPYDEVWRTGANATTTLATDFDLMFGNRHIAKGRYAVFTLPTREGWFLILQKDVGQGIGTYKAEDDVARIPLTHRTLGTPVEGLTMLLVPSSSGLNGEWRILWGTHELSTEWSAM